MKAESDKIAFLLHEFEKERLAREEAAAAKATQEKAETETKAAPKKESANAANAPLESAVKEVPNAAAIVKADNEKGIFLWDPLGDPKTSTHDTTGHWL